MSGASARIDTRAIQHNLKVIRGYAEHSKVLAVIKANGYGHGIVAVARALRDADALAVARIEEGVQLRDADVDTPIVLLGGVESTTQLETAVARNLQIVVHTEEHLRLLESWAGDPVSVWLKFDSGMHRLGFSIAEFRQAQVRLSQLACVDRKVRLMSHFASAEEADAKTSRRQLKKFRSATEDLPGEKSMANSAGILSIPESHFDWVRPGLMLYGVSPLAGQTGADLSLKPVMRLTTRVVAIKPVGAGESVGYGGRWSARRDTVIGIAAVGYGDGYPWRLPDETPVMINGRQYPLAGRVSMDMIAIELGTDSGVTYGDRVVLWGDELPIERIAEQAGTIPYELLCGVTQRVATELV